MKLTQSRIRQIIKEEITLVMGPELGGCADLSDDLAEWLGKTRALQLWFHGAHHLVGGPSFAGDHGILYDRIYSAFQGGFDADVEKALGVTRDQSVGCPLKHLAIAHDLLSKVPSPSMLPTEQIAVVGLEMILAHISYLEHLFEKLEDAGKLTLGLNDHLAARANEAESYAYLLQQRVLTK